ncbi:hypothetical protein [Psychroserpens luteus]|uniref:ApeA N-terminal domain-containing protein n=1 Tax=Psychroserpens luteus TaxID=1434066 RepID=A0ABW5ZV37_9FLAO|nr:hypothetical protein [Psychroserpens luteus]
MAIINKQIAPNLKLLELLKTDRNGILSVHTSPKHPYTNLNCNISFTDNITLDPDPYITQKLNESDYKLKAETELKLSCTDIDYYILGKHIIPKHISLPNFDDPTVTSTSITKKVISNIHSISNKSKTHYKKTKYYRLLLPVENATILMRDFQPSWGIQIDNLNSPDILIKLSIDSQECHFYTVKKKEETFLGIDSQSKICYDEFTRVCNSILMTYAFLKGKYFGGEGYIFSYNYNKFENPLGMKTIDYAKSNLKGFELHTASPHKYMKFQEMKIEKDKNGVLQRVNRNTSLEYMNEFPTENYSNLCSLINSNGQVLRSIIILINSHSNTLELKVPSLFVALENISKMFAEVDKGESTLIEEGKIIKALKKIAHNAKKEVNKLKRDNEPKDLSEEDLNAYKANYARMCSKLDGLNRGTNNKKLSEPFDKFNYKLSQDESDAIFIDRNKFLHGDDFLSNNIDYEVEFKGLFHISMIVHKLTAILILKASGFSGHIVNLPKVYSYISEKKVEGKCLVKI